LERDEHAYVDYVTVVATKTIIISAEDFSPITVEVLQNGTIRWLGEHLQLITQAKPIPPIPVKAIRVNQTINGVDQEVPFQVEDWASDYHVPLGLTNNASIFSSRNMLVFLVNPKVSKITIWWNGSDKVTQTPYAYVNRYFNDQPPTESNPIGTLRNGRVTLTIDASGTSFLVKSRINTIETIANFMRANDEWSIYGSDPAYAIYNGVVRDIVHAEAEWSGGIPDCTNVYSHIVITLPANTTYYTYQLRLIFLESTNNPRTIKDLCPIQISTSSSGSFSALTENGTLGLYPMVSTTSGLFYNMSGVWQHHWTQINSSITRGFGIMFTDTANKLLYYFDDKEEYKTSGKQTGALNVIATSRTIELLPVAKSLNAPVSSENTLDIMWCGAVVTFDDTYPIYINRGGSVSGLWVFVEHPPVITVTAES
ncbi:MAG: hypothetical protein QXF53_00740, partial [Candidatus Bathyarchaeia archaeon]